MKEILVTEYFPILHVAATVAHAVEQQPTLRKNIYRCYEASGAPYGDLSPPI